MHFHMFYNMGLACNVQCPGKGSIDKRFSYIKHCCDSDIVEEQFLVTRIVRRDKLVGNFHLVEVILTG